MSHIPDLTEDEQQSSAKDVGHKAKVHAARMRLQQTHDQADALDAIREIAGNLIGTEQVAVFNADKERQELWLYWSFGIDPNKHCVLEVHHEPNIRQILEGKPVFRCAGPSRSLLSIEDPVSALVPIVINGNVCAVSCCSGSLRTNRESKRWIRTFVRCCRTVPGERLNRVARAEQEKIWLT